MEIVNDANLYEYTFVIPCFNEERNLPKLIFEISAYTKANSDCKFILVENGSTDDSRGFLNSLNPSSAFRVIYLEQNKGYGGGIWEGVKLSESKMTGWFHADLQIPFEEVIRIKDLSKKEKTSVKGKRFDRPLSDTLLTKGMSLFCSLIFTSILVDINGQPTIYETRMLRENTSPPPDFSLDLYFYLTAKKQRIKLLRPKVRMIDRTEGASSWNTGMKSRLRMIVRTTKFAVQLRMRNKID